MGGGPALFLVVEKQSATGPPICIRFLSLTDGEQLLHVRFAMPQIEKHSPVVLP